MNDNSFLKLTQTFLEGLNFFANFSFVSQRVEPFIKSRHKKINNAELWSPLYIL